MVSYFRLFIILFVDHFKDLYPSIGRLHFISKTGSFFSSIEVLLIKSGLAYLNMLIIKELVSSNYVLSLLHLNISLGTFLQKFIFDIMLLIVAIFDSPAVMYTPSTLILDDWSIIY